MRLKASVNHGEAIKIKIWVKVVPKLKSRKTYLKLWTLANLKVLNSNLKLLFKDFISKQLILSKLLPKLKSHQIYLKVCALVNLKLLLVGSDFEQIN